MAYTKTTWVNNVTPLNATNMNNIETGIYDNSVNIGDLTNLSTTSKNNTVAAINEVNNGLPVAYTNEEIDTLLGIE